MRFRFVALLAFLAALTFCQSVEAQPVPTWKNDAQGRPAPPCMLLDATTGVSTPCSSTNPIPTSGGSGTGTTTGTSETGFGKAWFPSNITGSTAAGEQMIGLFIDDNTVAIFRRSTGCGNCLQVAISQDGGISGTFFSTTAGLGNSISAAHRVPATVPRYLVSSIGGPLNIFQSASLTSGWTAVVGLANPVVSWASNTNGTVTLASTTGNLVCRSTDAGQNFGSCVALAGGSLAFANGTTWLHTSGTTISRSTDDGATWSTIITGGATKVQPLCLAAAGTVCLVSLDDGSIIRSTNSGLTFPLTVDSGLGSPSQPAMCDYGGGNAAAINLRSAPIGLTAVTQDTHSSFNSGQSWFPGSRFGSAWNGTGTPSGAITCRAGRGWVGINVSGGGAQIFAEYNPLTSPGGTLTSSAGGYNVSAPIQAGIILSTTPTTSAANTAAAVTLTNTSGSRICARTIAIFASAAGAATVTVVDGATVVLNLGTVVLGTSAVGTIFQGVPLVCTTTSNNLVVNVGAAGVGVTTTTSVVGDRYPN